MAVLVHLALLAAVLLINSSYASVSLNYCSISCSDSGGHDAPSEQQRVVALPGKRGAVGPKGIRGSVGPQGPIGRPGANCSCVDYIRELEVMKTALSRLQNVVMAGWNKMRNKRWYKLFKTEVTYEEAKRNCQREGAQLASAGVRDADIRREMLSELDLGSNHVWIGLNDIAQEGEWMWEDGVRSSAANTDWRMGQPDNSRDAEDCAHFHAEGSINDNSCTATLYYVCETEEM